MKVLIVFTGLLLVCAAFVFYQNDMGRYMRAQTALKALAEECAAGAALYFDEEAYAEGRTIFNEDEARACVAYMLAASRVPAPDVRAAGPIAASVSFYDDRGAYGGSAGAFGFISHPSVVVRLRVATEDVFRLPFLTVTALEREAMYELPN
ncbi:MAG: hypothetical protein LBP73_08960 [Clostridiales Family XIII bacterium]|jgi:hypothetical protein|nr:hypothetical protein [Clostridiales Family XIII bacterium]